jgi:hypothetical protein
MLDTFFRTGERPRKLVSRTYKGIPDSVRGCAWVVLSGAAVQLNAQKGRYAVGLLNTYTQTNKQTHKQTHTHTHTYTHTHTHTHTLALVHSFTHTHPLGTQS